jgi:NAD-dependent dihydropyrimidine dehydrogenase PreA subunit/coenzyme F420-reducing hydrogenase delta subunit
MPADGGGGGGLEAKGLPADLIELARRASESPPGTGASDAPLAVEPEVRGEAVLRGLQRGFLYLDRFLGRVVPEQLNPFLHTGSIAITSLLVATVTGILLLVWYRPSVHLAYESVAAMGSAPWTAGLMRSLHRYSSDACMFFVLVHALLVFLERRIVGARWLAWVTGFAGVSVLWFVGWTGYWLVWDERAQHVALGTARALDVVPIFADPMGRSFLTDAGVNSLLFFVVFFVHMLIPLAIGFILWLHIARLSRARFLTRTPMTVWILGSLLLVSIAYPATNAEPARMTAVSEGFTMDWWYLAPLAMTDRLGGGALWATFLLGGVVGFSVPWVMARERRGVAEVDPRKCNACMKCYNDCPYNAITMIPRTDGSKRFDMQADVDPARCVGCGICAGSCDTAGVGVDWFAVPDQRWRFAMWLKQSIDAGEEANIAFVCAESAAASLEIHPETGICEDLPGYRVLKIPCGGWLHPFGVEHTLRYGGKRALVVTCPPGQCRYREGELWERLRLTGQREPALRTEKVPPDRMLLLGLDRTRKAELARRAAAFREGRDMEPVREPPRNVAGLVSVALAALLAIGLGLVSDLGYAAPGMAGSELVVTFKHPGQMSENCREFTPEELAALPAHMRREKVCDRARGSVRLRVPVDGERRVDGTYAPMGIWNDGNSIAVEHIPVPVGAHDVRVEIGDSLDAEEWTYTTIQKLEFTDDARRVVAFDRVAGFEFH